MDGASAEVTIAEQAPAETTVPDVVGLPAAPVAPQARRPAPERPEWAKPVVLMLGIVAGLAAWLLLFFGPLSALTASHHQSTLYSQFREELASGVNPPPPFSAGSVLKAGEPVAIMSIPAIGMKNEMVVEGTSSAELRSGPGHLPGTVLPGEAGVSSILGRAFAYGGPFSGLHTLRAGDTISITTGQGSYQYVVSDVRGPGQAIPGGLAAATSRLTLVTAANSGWRNLWVPTHAIYADAVIKGKAGPDAVVPAPTKADSPMAKDTSNLYLLVLWLQLQLLVVAAIAIVLLVRRWGRWQLWVVGAPVVVAVLWGATLQFTLLLPNLF